MSNNETLSSDSLANANGVTQKTNELKLFLHRHVANMAWITETHLTYDFKIPGYTAYSALHSDGTAHCGSMVLIKNNYKQYKNFRYCTLGYQTVAINVKRRQMILLHL